MEVLRGAHVVVSSDRPQPRELDGDVVDLEVWAEAGDGTVVMPGTATVRLPVT